ncbi:MAG: hypothetical protein NDJ24_03410 [Alphaproteobacteria bacterium]|nr:hypothetical protein [Alphaproteobacteria bacterium]
MARLSLSTLLAAAALTLSLQAQAQQTQEVQAPETPADTVASTPAQITIKPTLKPDCSPNKDPSAKSVAAAATGSLLNKALESWGRKKGIDGLGQMTGRGVQSTIDTCSSLPKGPTAQP